MKKNIIKIAIICLFTLLPLKAEHLSREQKNDIIKFMRNYERITKDCARNSNLSICSDKPREAMR
jgi:hypothetical protein